MKGGTACLGPYLEDAGEEELLQLFVGKVDAELLEGIGLELLEAKDVEETNVAHITERLAIGDKIVDAGDEPIEETDVDHLAEGVACVRGFCDRELLGET